MPTGGRRRVVIVGGGFGGLSAAKALMNSDVDVTLIDKTNHHLFQPLLYQVATAALSPGDVAQPIRSILRSSRNLHVVMTTVTNIDTQRKEVITTDGAYQYDSLILAPGARHSYFGHEEWEQNAPGLKDLSDALLIRERILRTFEEAEHHAATVVARTMLTFVVVGGGPTGVELAGAIAEISLRTMLPDFPRLKRSDVRVILVEGGPRILSSFSESHSIKAVKMLQRLGVEVMCDSAVSDVNDHGVMVGNEFIASRNVIWAAGNKASQLLETLDVELDRAGRVLVNPDCSVPLLSDVFVIGDGAHFNTLNGPLPGVAQVAMQQGVYVAKLIKKNIPREGRAPFHYRDYGTMATIGRAKAVAHVFGIRSSGLIAWLMWAVIHVMQLISFRNRLKVMVEWMWYYISFQPGARLIIDRDEVSPAGSTQPKIDLKQR
ncbi:MAG: NAD(P)/FAD-dependent oxidoreductase [Candidatus Kapabacteria bacterium]|nr:NAD(P)/FAD-dependent oxidoreductase [Ignavibacteria bacterium]MBL0321139.1 NAD(P)/FAD-dependent oxidoreductase [Ignavibacteria bacterium]MBP6509191.1 NAD(P)/FAD-dependent oxidoreductase [Candidatus Kapabacteria bacterium]